MGVDFIEQNIGVLAGVDHKSWLKIQVEELKEYFELDGEVERVEWVTGSRLYGQVNISAVPVYIIAGRVGWKFFEMKALYGQLAAF